MAASKTAEIIRHLDEKKLTVKEIATAVGTKPGFVYNVRGRHLKGTIATPRTRAGRKRRGASMPKSNGVPAPALMDRVMATRSTIADTVEGLESEIALKKAEVRELERQHGALFGALKTLAK